MKKIKNLLLKKILSCNSEPAECMYGPPEWYYEDDKEDSGFWDKLPDNVEENEKNQQNKETDNDRI